MTAFTCTFAFVLAAALLQPSDDSPAGAKEMFFAPGRSVADASSATARRSFDDKGRRVAQVSRETAEKHDLGLSYWIELISTAGKRGQQVTAERVFRSGDGIRLHFRANDDGNIVLVQLGSSGEATILFPDARTGLGDNRIRANKEHVLPSNRHVFRFDENAGTERLLVLFARDQAELDRTFPTRPVMDAAATAALLRAVRQSKGSKDLFIQTETEETSEIGVYAVERAGRPMAVEISLVHR